MLSHVFGNIILAQTEMHLEEEIKQYYHETSKHLNL